MNRLSCVKFMLSISLIAMLPACRTAEPLLLTGIPTVPAELAEKTYLFEVIRYLYRWQMTEDELERMVGADRLLLWVQRSDVPLDAGDCSLFGEILLPQAGLRVKVKKADYCIEELGTEVKSPSFRIVQVLREPLKGRMPRAAQKVEINVEELRDYLFRTRSQSDYPDQALLERLQRAVRKQAMQEGLLSVGTEEIDGDKIVHIAPLSPVANEIWVFWEAGRKLLLFSSDIDLSNPAVWDNESLMSSIFDLDKQVIVSPDEAPGSNRFLTRYQVSRALFNCLMYGQRLKIQPPKIEDITIQTE